MADAILALINREFEKAEKAERGMDTIEFFCRFMKNEFDMLVRNVSNPQLYMLEDESPPNSLWLHRIPGEVARNVLQRYFWGYYHSHKMVLTMLIQKYPKISPFSPNPRYIYDMLASISKDYKQPILDLASAQQEVEKLKKQLYEAEQKVEEFKKKQTS